MSEVQTLLQSLLSTTYFAGVYTSLRTAMVEKRQERKTARLMHSIHNPEGAARKKVKTNEKKHQARSRRNQEFARGKERVKGSSGAAGARRERERRE